MLIEELRDGPLDIIGDVHGELDVLEALVRELGYDRDGRHPDGRHLVFVGDLTDRGHDSPGVVRRVGELVRRGRAQCVLGNHELNILREDRKPGNAWFFGEIERDQGAATGERIADGATRDAVRELFFGLPLALERADVRVVHACWDQGHIEALRGARGPVTTLSRELADRIDRDLDAEGHVADTSPLPVHDERERPPLPRARARRDVERQNRHPIKVITSGIETVAEEPFWAGGRWRFASRVRWWNDYRGPMVVVGHYWRSLGPKERRGTGPDLFAGTAPDAPLGPAGRVMCVDYSIGRRPRERRRGDRRFRTALAAYRWPENRLVVSPL